jgi:hypothetical protein
MELSLELVDSMRPLVQGTYVMPRLGRYDTAAARVRQGRAWEAPST